MKELREEFKREEVEEFESSPREKVSSKAMEQGGGTSSYEPQGNKANSCTFFNLKNHCVSSHSLSLCDLDEFSPCVETNVFSMSVTRVKRVTCLIRKIVVLFLEIH